MYKAMNMLIYKGLRDRVMHTQISLIFFEALKALIYKGLRAMMYNLVFAFGVDILHTMCYYTCGGAEHGRPETV